MGMDPKKLDPAMLAALGMDPKTLQMDPAMLQALGLDPKNPNSSLMVAMAAMDPNMAAMYGMAMPGMNQMMGLPGAAGDKSKSGDKSASSKSSQGRDVHSPRTSRASPSPRPPSR